MSGRIRPPSASEVTCSSKSQCSSIPAISTTRRSCSSPQRPAGLGRAQRGDQVAGLLLQLVVRGGQVLHLLGQGGVGPLPLDLEPLHPLLVLAELLADGLEQLLDGLLPLGQLPVGGLAGLVELGVGQLEELLVVLLQGQRREPGELPGQLLAGLARRRRPAGRRRGARARARRSGGPPRLGQARRWLLVGQLSERSSVDARRRAPGSVRARRPGGPRPSGPPATWPARTSRPTTTPAATPTTSPTYESDDHVESSRGRSGTWRPAASVPTGCTTTGTPPGRQRAPRRGRSAW